MWYNIPILSVVKMVGLMQRINKYSNLVYSLDAVSQSQLIPLMLLSDDDSSDDEDTECEIMHLAVTQWQAPTYKTLKENESLGTTLDGSPRYNYTFRGDLRSPDIVFETGFFPKVRAQDKQKILALPFASYLSYAVPMTSNLQSAAIFSVSTRQPSGWIYFIETKRAYNIAKDSICMLHDKSIDPKLKEGTSDYLNESLASHIDPEEIICAIYIEHQGVMSASFRKDVPEQSPEGSFIVGEIIMNPLYLLVKNNEIPRHIIDYLESIGGETLNYSMLDREMTSVALSKSRRHFTNVHFWEDWPEEGKIELPDNYHARLVILKRLERTQREVLIHTVVEGLEEQITGTIFLSKFNGKDRVNATDSAFSAKVENIVKIDLLVEKNKNVPKNY